MSVSPQNGQRAAAIGFLRRRGTERKEADAAIGSPPNATDDPSIASNPLLLVRKPTLNTGVPGTPRSDPIPVSPAAEQLHRKYSATSETHDLTSLSPQSNALYQQQPPASFRGLVSLERISFMLQRKEEELRFEKEAEEANETTFERKARHAEEKRNREREAAARDGPPALPPASPEEKLAQRAIAIGFLGANRRRAATDAPKVDLDQQSDSPSDAAASSPRRPNTPEARLPDDVRKNSFMRRTASVRNARRSDSGSLSLNEGRDDLDGPYPYAGAPHSDTASDPSGHDNGFLVHEGDSFELNNGVDKRSNRHSPPHFSSSVPMHVDPSMPMPNMPAGFPVRSSSRPRMLAPPKKEHAIEVPGIFAPTSPRSPRSPLGRAETTRPRQVPYGHEDGDDDGVWSDTDPNANAREPRGMTLMVPPSVARVHASGLMSPPESPSYDQRRGRSESELPVPEDLPVPAAFATSVVRTPALQAIHESLPIREEYRAALQYPTPLSLDSSRTQSPVVPVSFLNRSREFLQQGRAWQVITTSTVKDRYLFLFTDVLVIAKQIHEDLSDPQNTTFQIKNILALTNSQLVLKDERWQYTPRAPSPAVLAAVKKFSTNPIKAVAYLISKRAFPCTPDAIAHFLHGTPGLSKRQLGRFLGVQEHQDILEAFLGMLHFKGMRIDEALRLFLSTVRLPGETVIIDQVLDAFSKRWYQCNKESVHAEGNVILKLVFAVMELNADLHNPYADEGGKVTMREFVDRFRTGIRAEAVAAGSGVLYSSGITTEVLGAIYESVRKEKLEMAEVDWDLAVKARIVVQVDVDATGTPITGPAAEVRRTPSQSRDVHRARTTADEDAEVAAASAAAELTLPPFPSRLTLKHTSAAITVRIPFPDPHLRIHLYGHDLQFTPAILTFAASNTANFTIRGMGLGRKLVFFSKRGAAARRYLTPFTRQITIEPAFLRHSFQLSFYPGADGSDLNAQPAPSSSTVSLGTSPATLVSQKRKYLFAVSDQNTRASWLTALAAADLRPNEPPKRSPFSDPSQRHRSTHHQSRYDSSSRSHHRGTSATSHRHRHPNGPSSSASRVRSVSTTSSRSTGTSASNVNTSDDNRSFSDRSDNARRPTDPPRRTRTRTRTISSSALSPPVSEDGDRGRVSERSFYDEEEDDHEEDSEEDEELAAISQLVAHRVLKETVLPVEHIFPARDIVDAVVKNARVEVVLGFLRDQGLLQRDR
ncbi:hypothetical protein HKX48_005040 [Thoreauomyces humboldtii]|nr:hypothetical protein HKX48_005040 [Thoreauomyces humboldtii]